MVYVSPGSFRMGVFGDSEEIQPSVKIRKFYMGQAPVTPAQYTAVMGESAWLNGKLPVALVPWFDAWTFCQRLSDQTRRLYRLPSEVEWGYACLLANKFGLHYTHRDYWEWCDQDLDGVWWQLSPDLSHGTDNNGMPPDHRYHQLSFRVVLADGD